MQIAADIAPCFLHPAFERLVFYTYAVALEPFREVVSPRLDVLCVK